MANSLISMIKGDSTLIDKTELLDGQLLLDETNKKIYLDDNNKRIDFSQGGGETSSDANLAYVEEGTVATRGYAAGAYVIVEGQLYKTLTQINSGTTFITEGVNANVEATNIGSEVTQLNNDLPTVTQYSPDVYVYGKVCTVFLHGDKDYYSIPTPAKNQYMATRTLNINNSNFGDAYLSYTGNASFTGQTGANTVGIITFIIA